MNAVSFLFSYSKSHRKRKNTFLKSRLRLLRIVEEVLSSSFFSLSCSLSIKRKGEPRSCKTMKIKPDIWQIAKEREKRKSAAQLPTWPPKRLKYQGYAKYFLPSLCKGNQSEGQMVFFSSFEMPVGCRRWCKLKLQRLRLIS